MTAYQAGESPRKVREDHVFDINIIGERHIWSISSISVLNIRSTESFIKAIDPVVQQTLFRFPLVQPPLFLKLTRSDSSDMK